MSGMQWVVERAMHGRLAGLPVYLPGSLEICSFTMSITTYPEEHLHRL